MEDAMRQVTGILYHPVFDRTRPDVVFSPGPGRSVRISGPQNHLDGFSRALENSGMSLHRPAPATLLVLF
jgi:hypothetical protein